MVKMGDESFASLFYSLSNLLSTFIFAHLFRSSSYFQFLIYEIDITVFFSYFFLITTFVTIITMLDAVDTRVGNYICMHITHTLLSNF